MSSCHWLFQNQQWRHQNNMWKLFKVTNKDSRAASLASLWCPYCWLEQISHIGLSFSFITLNKNMLGSWVIEFRTLYNASCLKLKIHDFIENNASYPLKMFDVFALNVGLFLSFLKWNGRRQLLLFFFFFFLLALFCCCMVSTSLFVKRGLFGSGVFWL